MTLTFGRWIAQHIPDVMHPSERGTEDEVGQKTYSDSLSSLLR